MSRIVATLRAATVEGWTADLQAVATRQGGDARLPWEAVESALVALVSLAFDPSEPSEGLRSDDFPIPQLSAALRRTPEEIRDAILSASGADPTIAAAGARAALSQDDTLAGDVNDKLLAAARAANLTPEGLPDFYSEFVVARHAVKHRELFSDLARPGAARTGTSARRLGAARLSRSRAVPKFHGERTTPVAPSRTSLIAARTARALEMRRDGSTLAEIGAELGLTRERVRQILATVDAPSADEVRAMQNAKREVDLQRRREECADFLQQRPPMTVSQAATALGMDRADLGELLDDTLRRLLLPDPKKGQTKWPREQVVAVLQEAATLEYPLTAKGYAELVEGRFIRGPSVARIHQVFGSWVAACTAAGIEAGVRPRTDYSSKWTDDDLVDAVRRYLGQADRRTFAGYCLWAEGQDDRPSGGTVRNRLGRWSEILRRVHEVDYFERSARDE